MATQKVIIASLNPAKITAVESAFTSAFPDGTFEFVGCMSLVKWPISQ